MSLVPPVITAVLASVLIFIQMALLLGVVILRRRNRQSIGDGGNEQLLVAIRRHGNFAENAGIFLACFALLEILGGGGLGFNILCAAFVLSRISHIIGLSMKQTVNRFRIGGIILTVGVGIALGERLMRIALPHLGG
jgi:uncharacterized membrane protein YecN with MAPEG domain